MIPGLRCVKPPLTWHKVWDCAIPRQRSWVADAAPPIPLLSSVAFIPPFFPCVLSLSSYPPTYIRIYTFHATYPISLPPSSPTLSFNTRESSEALQNAYHNGRGESFTKFWRFQSRGVVVDVRALSLFIARHIGAPCNFFQHRKQ